MCLTFFKNLFGKKTESEVVAPFLVALRRVGGAPAAPSGGGGGDVTLAEFTLTNWNSGGASGVNYIVGHVIKQGDAPNTGALVLTTTSDVDVPCGFADRVLYANGDVAMAHLCIQDSTLSASGMRTYRLKFRPGASYNDTGQGTSWATLLTAVKNPKIAFTSVTDTDDTNTETHGSGSMLGKMSDVNSTYVDVVIDNPQCKRFVGEAYVKDGADGAGSADAHLKIIWVATIWYDAGGSIEAIDVEPGPYQAEVAVASKKRLNYTAVFSNDDGTIETYSTLQHYYRGAWLAVDKSASNASGRPFRLVGTASTCTPTYDKDYWFAAECFFNGVLDPDFTPDEATGDGAGSVETYSPLTVQGQRVFIDEGGGYTERGPMGQVAIHAIMRQGARDWRLNRVQGMVGPHLPYHYHPPIGAYKPSVLTLRLDDDGGAGSASAWTGDGMPTAIYCSVGTSFDTGYGGGYVVHEGGNGPWTPSSDSSHAVNPSILPWIVEGSWHMLRATQDIAIKGMINDTHANIYGTRPNLYPGWPEAEAVFSYGVPSTQWSSIAIGGNKQERDYGWSALRTAEACFFTPASYRERNFFTDYAANQARFWELSLPYLDADYSYFDGGSSMTSPWQNGICALGFNTLALLIPEQGFLDLADWVNAEIAGRFDRDLVRVDAYRATYRTKTRAWNASTNPWRTRDDMLVLLGAACIGGSTDTITIAARTLANGDIFYPSIANDSFGAVSVMPGTTEGTPYYAIGTTDNGDGTFTCQLSTSPGGSKIDLTTGDYWWLWDPQADNTSFTTTDSSHYGRIALFVLSLANARGYAGATAGKITAYKANLAPADNSDLGQWKVA